MGCLFVCRLQSQLCSGMWSTIATCVQYVVYNHNFVFYYVIYNRNFVLLCGLQSQLCSRMWSTIATLFQYAIYNRNFALVCGLQLQLWSSIRSTRITTLFYYSMQSTYCNMLSTSVEFVPLCGLQYMLLSRVFAISTCLILYLGVLISI